jgi:hypothetical protein
MKQNTVYQKLNTIDKPLANKNKMTEDTPL